MVESPVPERAVERGEVVIRVPFALVPPNPLARERFVRDALSGDNDDYSKSEARAMAVQLYAANEALYRVVAADRMLLRRLVLAYAADKVPGMPEEVVAESVGAVLRAAVDGMPAGEEKSLLEKVKEVEVLLEEYAEPLLASMVFEGEAGVEVALKVE